MLTNWKCLHGNECNREDPRVWNAPGVPGSKECPCECHRYDLRSDLHTDEVDNTQFTIRCEGCSTLAKSAVDPDTAVINARMAGFRNFRGQWLCRECTAQVTTISTLAPPADYA